MLTSDQVFTIIVQVISFIGAVMASSGFWYFIQKKAESKSITVQLLLGLAQDRINNLGLKYINRGCISKEEYETLKTYLYDPYVKMGGNSMAGRIMGEVERLPIKNHSISDTYKELSCHEHDPA